jgi:hypothetical protein
MNLCIYEDSQPETFTLSGVQVDGSLLKSCLARAL